MELNKEPLPIQEEYRHDFDTAFKNRDLEVERRNATLNTLDANIGLSVLEPIYHIGSAIGALDKKSHFGQALGNKIADEHAKIQEFEDVGASSTAGALSRIAPELLFGYLTPLKLYKASIPFGGGTSLPLGGAIGAASSAFWQEARTGEIDPVMVGTIGFGSQIIGSSAAAVTKLKNGGKTNGYWDVYTAEQGINLAKKARDEYRVLRNGVSNAAANAITASKGRTSDLLPIVGVGGLVASENDAEASFLSSAFRATSNVWQDVKINTGLKVIGESETNAVIKEARVKISDPAASALAIEKQLIADLEDIQKVSMKDLPNDAVTSIGKEFSRNLDDFKTPIDMSVDDIISTAHRTIKQESSEISSFYHKNIDEAFPLDVTGNKEIRNALGNTFKTGMEFDDVVQFVQKGTKEVDDYIESNLSKLTKVQKEGVDTYAKQIAKYNQDNTSALTIAKNATSAMNKLGIDNNAMMKEVIDLKAKLEGFKLLNSDDITMVNKAITEQPMTVRSAFGARTATKAKTEELIQTGSLKQDDELFGYVSETYKNKVKTSIMSKDELATLKATDEYQRKLNKVLGKEEGLIHKVEKLPDGNYKVIHTNKNDFAQGAIPVQRQEVRGRSIRTYGDLAKLPVNDFISFMGKENLMGVRPSKISMRVFNKNGKSLLHNDIVTMKEYKTRIAKLDKAGTTYKDKSTVFEYTKPLSNKDKEVLGVSNDIADVAGNTIAAVQKNLAKENLFRDIKTNYSAKISSDNVDEFLKNATTDPRYLFISPKDITMFNDPKFMQYVANNYVRITDPDMLKQTGARYVQKRHAFDLLGYEKVFISQDVNGLGRFMENLYESSVDMFRGAIIIKNPVALLNNTVGMAFTNFAYMYMELGHLGTKAFTGLSSSLKSYKDFKNLRSELLKHKSLNLDTKDIRTKLESNMAYQLYKRGGLQSLLDDGLVNRNLAENAANWSTGRSAVENLFMTEGSKTGQWARNMHDMSDISNRVNMFTMLVESGKTMDEAARITTSISVDYSRLLSPSMMFARNKGMIPFVSWYTRMAPVMVSMIERNPMRFAQLQGMYLVIQNSLGGENQYGDDYIGGVRVESWNMFNALALNNILDPLSPVPAMMIEGSGILPQYMEHAVKSPEKLLGISTGSNW